MMVEIILKTSFGFIFLEVPSSTSIVSSNSLPSRNNLNLILSPTGKRPILFLTSFAFLIFFPFAFLTPSMLPRELMSGWLKTVAAWNPVTYLLEGMRSVLSDGWDLGALVKAAAAILGLAVVTFTMAFRSLARRVATG